METLFTTPLPPLASAFRKITTHHARGFAPILQTVLMTVEPGKATLTYSDTDTEISYTLAATTSQTLTTLLPLHAVRQLLDTLSGGELRQPDDVHFSICTVDNQFIADQIEISCCGLTARFTPLDQAPEDYPRIDFPDDRSPLPLNGIDLGASLRRVHRCISREEARYYLNGVHFSVDGGQLDIVATDGHKLALAHHNVETGWDHALNREVEGAVNPTGFTLTRDAVKALLGLIQPGERLDLQLDARRTLVRIQGVNWALTSKLIDGHYPDYRRVFPDIDPGTTPWAQVRAGDLADAIRQLALAILSEQASPDEEDWLDDDWEGAEQLLNTPTGPRVWESRLLVISHHPKGLLCAMKGPLGGHVTVAANISAERIIAGKSDANFEVRLNCRFACDVAEGFDPSDTLLIQGAVMGKDNPVNTTHWSVPGQTGPVGLLTEVRKGASS
ncbi:MULTISPECIES: DNA polymerase III subunit beta [unclassified Oceanicaulis]|uniref:DNA polymerase III subunit beta n=1 Tax=unclassified Oceanicaulis TaxID=2632123 RepID=UPI0025FD4F37|nr:MULTISPECIES: DNA polymerase III subunit beta [unclassified Oceanicaulis]